METLQKIWKETGITPAETAYIGDDVNDREALRAVGYKACPADAVPAIKEIPGIHILEAKGGHG